MILIRNFLSRFTSQSSRITKCAVATLLVFTSSTLTIASQPTASALPAYPVVTAPPPTVFANNAAHQEPGNFVISNFGINDPLLVTVDLVNPPTETSFVLPITTGLTAGYGYDFAVKNSQISFIGTQADANTALAAMTVSTGSFSGNVEIRVSASPSIANVYFNPVNGHYYEYVSAPASTDCNQGANATCITNIENAIASKMVFGAKGYWATITSAQENTFIANKMDAPDIAIGLSDRETEGTFRWLHGPEKGEATFFNWAGNEPNNYDGCGTEDDSWFDPMCAPGEDYVVTNWNGEVGNWNDHGRPLHSRTYSYIVEYSSDCYSLNSGNCVSGVFSASSQAHASVTSVVGWGNARPAIFSESTLLPSQQEIYTSSVSCSSPGNCTAVGQFKNSIGGYEAFTMTSTNGAWSGARPAVFDTGIQNNSPNAVLSSVSCSSPGSCTAIGQFRNSVGGSWAFTMTSTNGVWSTARPAIFDTGYQNAASDDSLLSVSCASPGNCTAVGNFLNTSGEYEAFTMTSTNGAWNDARPAVFDTGIQSNSPITVFNSVSCASSGNCTAVGMYKNINGGFEGMTMTSTNDAWSTARPAVVGAIQPETKYGFFTSVSCASPGNCTAVGLVKNTNNANEAFTMTSTNGAWALARPAVFPPELQDESRYGIFNSVACTTPGNCTAVGRFMDAQGEMQAITMSLANGVWDLARPAEFNPGYRNAVPDDGFTSVSCATPGNCTAAGYFMKSNGSKTPVTYTSKNGVWNYAEPAEFSDGVRSNSGFAGFNSVSCPTPGNCTAIGDFADTEGGRRAFTATSSQQTSLPPDEGWDQARPAEFPNGLFGSSEITVSSVSCATPGNCTVVGAFQHVIYVQGFQAFTMTSTNGVWAPARVALFPNGAQPDTNIFTVLRSVSCASPGNCTAVGSFRNREGAQEVFTMSSTNGAWDLARPAVFPAEVQHMNPGANFKSVSCISPGNCTAVGNFLNSDYNQEAFTMTSTNGAWALARPAVFASDVQSDSPSDVFNSVSCASPGNCTAVGTFFNSRNNQEAFTMTSTNGAWALARPAIFASGVQSDSPSDVFNSVSCASPGNCTAVGKFKNIDNSREAFTMASTNGVWEFARPAVFASGIQPISPIAELYSVSCASPGNCTAVGNFNNMSDATEAFTMTSTSGVWELARPAVFVSGIQNNFPNTQLTSVSCASPGNCTAVGAFLNRNSNNAAFTMTSTDGVWDLARPAVFVSGVQSDLPPTYLSSVSCASPGNCTAAGDFVLTPNAAGAMFTMSSKTLPVSSPTTTVAPTSTTSTIVPLPTITVVPATTATTVGSPTRNATEKNTSAGSASTLPTTGKNLGLTYCAIYVLLIGIMIFLARKKLSN